jgi:phage anti-repressor protein
LRKINLKNQTMFTDFNTILGQSVNLTELYDFLELDKSQYSRFVKSKILKNEFAEYNKDYLTIVSSENLGKRGNFRQEYILHIDFAKKICMVSKSKKAEEIRNYLVKLTKQVENNDLLNHDQIIYLTKLKEFFKYAENQKQIEKIHLQKFVENSTSKIPYAEFHSYRNQILEIEPEKIDQLIKNFCIENQRNLPKKSDKRTLLNVIDNHITLKNAIWDFLNIKGEINALKLANLVKRMADAENLQCYQRNENNFFQSKENIHIKEISNL